MPPTPTPDPFPLPDLNNLPAVLSGLVCAVALFGVFLMIAGRRR